MLLGAPGGGRLAVARHRVVRLHGDAAAAHPGEERHPAPALARGPQVRFVGELGDDRLEVLVGRDEVFEEDLAVHKVVVHLEPVDHLADLAARQLRVQRVQQVAQLLVVNLAG